MQKIDRLGWASGICIEAYGLKIGIRCNQPEVPEQVWHCLPPDWQPAEPPFVDYLLSLRIGGEEPGGRIRQYHLLYAGLRRAARTMEVDQLFRSLQMEIELFVGEWSTDRVFVHAGVVGWRGQAIILPGNSFSGKSTLVAALLRAGATYYSDEYAVLDEAGNVHPFPRPLFLRTPMGEPDRHVRPEEFGANAGRKPLPVGLVAITRYRAAARWQPIAIKPGRALVGLMTSTLPMQRQPEKSLTTLQQVVRQSRHLKGFRGEAEPTAGLLLQQAG